MVGWVCGGVKVGLFVLLVVVWFFVFIYLEVCGCIVSEENVITERGESKQKCFSNTRF